MVRRVPVAVGLFGKRGVAGWHHGAVHDERGVLREPTAGLDRERRADLVDDAVAHGLGYSNSRASWRSVKFERRYTATSSARSFRGRPSSKTDGRYRQVGRTSEICMTEREPSMRARHRLPGLPWNSHTWSFLRITRRPRAVSLGRVPASYHSTLGAHRRRQPGWHRYTGRCGPARAAVMAHWEATRTNSGASPAPSLPLAYPCGLSDLSYVVIRPVGACATPHGDDVARHDQQEL